MLCVTCLKRVFRHTFVLRHWFSTGHEDLSLQLQLFSSMFSSSLRSIFVLCALTMLSMFGMHEYESLTVLSLNRRWRGCCLGKCKRSSLKIPCQY